VCIFGLSSASVNAQTDKSILKKSPFENGAAESRGIYCYDSLEVLEIGNIILENDMLLANEKEYQKRDSLQVLKSGLFENKINDLGKIISYKDEQLKKMESVSAELKGARWKWWQYTLAFIGAATFGFTAGVIFEIQK
jgi:hypothetical protein